MADTRKPVTAEVEIKHGHCVSGCFENYAANGTTHCWGLPLTALFPDRNLHEGAVFRVTVEVVKNGRPCRNPFLRKRKEARRG